jgi:outer membrane protein OmpA-like peptidoglycan-associated protein
MKYVSLLFLGLPFLLSAPPAWAEDPSLEEMVCALNPQCAAPVAGRRMRGISVSPTVASPTVARPPASFDITLNFPFNSAELTADSRERLDRVAKALTDATTVNSDIIISGHTDALGGDRYNQALSERRAQAVRRFLITERGINPRRLVAKGYGRSQLLLPDDPYNERNRRVQFQNAKYATAAAPSSQAPSAGTSRAQPRKPDEPAARPAAPASSAPQSEGL